MRTCFVAAVAAFSLTISTAWSNDLFSGFGIDSQMSAWVTKLHHAYFYGTDQGAQVGLGVRAGSTDQGASIGGAITLAEARGNTATLEVHYGKPFIRVSGAAELIPVELKGRVVLFENAGGVGALQLKIIPLDVDGQYTKLDDETAFGHLVVTPEVVLQALGIFGFDPEALLSGGGPALFSARLKAGVSGGRAMDADGSASVFGLTVGFDVNGVIPMGKLDHRFKFHAGAKVTNDLGLADRFDSAYGADVGFGVELVRRSALYYIGLKAEATKYNVTALEGEQELDDGKAVFVGVVGDIRF